MVIGHQRNIRYLKRVLELGTLAHAYLLHGPAGVGKRTAALEFVKALLCPEQSMPALGGCRQCEDCRRVEALTHPDLLFLAFDRPLVPEENKREIGIRSIHELRRLLGLAAWRGGWRAVIVDDAETLSRDAQSALLKLIEEPGERVIFFLITASPGRLLPTVHSRSVPLGFALVGDEDITPLLARAPAVERTLFQSLGHGRPGLIARFLADRKFFESMRARDREFSKLLRADLPEQFAFAEGESRSDSAERLQSFFTFLLERLYRELVSAAVPSLLSADSSRALKLAAFVSLLLEKLFLLETTAVNRRLLADSMFFELQHLVLRTSL